jgi:serine/threonine protein kinase/Tol biopolymer transport system component
MTPDRWKQIDALLDSALEQEPSRRASFLVQACDGDEALRQEVEALLAAHEQAGSFLASEAAAKGIVVVESPDLAGQVIGPYQILSVLGKGGMGEVYLAQDNRLGRKVALKLLPSQFTQDRGRLGRFEREARAASALNHPNILTIYEIAEQNGNIFIATEFIEGQTLRQRMAGERLPLLEALDVAAQVSSALATAHAAGIVHRDIKPENIMLRRDGFVKVLDFGLAKLSGRQGVISGDQDAKSYWTETEAGVLIGTTRYMSPEQARGLRLDTRTDLFSLGVVMYEMMAGRPPFVGETATDVIIAIVETEPTPLSQCANVPAELEKIVAKALSKNVEARYQTASELENDLKRLKRRLPTETDLVPEPSQKKPKKFNQLTIPGRGYRFAEPIRKEETGHDLLTSRGRARRGRLALTRWVGLAIALVLAAGIAVWFQLSPARQSSVPPPRVVPFTSLLGNEVDPTFSPDGNQLAYSWGGTKDDNYDIYVKLIGAGEEPLRLTHHPDADVSPAWSPDGHYVAFVRESKTGAEVFLVPALGGHERKLSDVAEVTTIRPPYLAWSRDGESLVIVDRGSPQDQHSLFVFSIETGERRRLTSPARSFSDSGPAVSPDGKTVAFFRHSDAAVDGVYVVPFTGGTPRRLTFFDNQIVGLSWSADGREIIFSSDPSCLPGGNLWRVGVSGGTPEPVRGVGEGASYPSVSRQGNRLAYVQWASDQNIWRVDGIAATHTSAEPLKLIASTRNDESPRYSPDGKKIAFLSDRSGNYSFWICDSEGREAFLLPSDGKAGSHNWSPDGKRIAFDFVTSGYWNIFTISSEAGGSHQLTFEKSNNARPSWSRDGHWIYFDSDRGGNFQVWKMPSSGGPAVQVTRTGGHNAQESPDGKFLYYSKDPIPGLWRIPVGGGEEVLVVKTLGDGLERYWDIIDKGIYFVARVSDNWDSHPAAILKFMSFSTNQIREIAPLENPPFYGDQGLSASPDGRWVLYEGWEGVGGDIMLVENFH